MQSNTRIILFRNRVYPHPIPSPIIWDSYCGFSRPQVDNARAQIKQCQSFGNNSLSAAHQPLTFYTSGHCSCPMSSRLFFSVFNKEHNYKYTVETLPGKLVAIKSNSQPQPLTELSGKPSVESPVWKLHLQLQTVSRKQTKHILCHELVV